MSAMEIETLLTVLEADGRIASHELGYLLTRSRRAIGHGDAYETGRRRALPLLRGGALRKPRPGVYEITEKGRIAAALLIARDPALGDKPRDGDGGVAP